MGWQEAMKQKHSAQMIAHEQSYGAPIGVLKTEPTKSFLDAEYDRRQREGKLLSQQAGA